jgi:hypothetical protein
MTNNFRLTFPIHPIATPLEYRDQLLLMGSCFAEEIGNKLQDNHFDVQVNPHGILYNPLNIAEAIQRYLDGKQYSEGELFQHGDLWHSWDHHSRFSALNPEEALEKMNTAAADATKRLETADWLFITLGTAHIYTLKEGNRLVGNCHKVPAASFQKRMLSPQEIISALDNMMHRLFFRNKKIKIMFTVSPVRYVKDGVVENNLSKAVLLQAVHHLVNKFNRLFYFPAYELVLDDLRDYRFYKDDLVHPNETAINYVWEHFTANCLSKEGQQLLPQIEELNRAMQHRPFNPESPQHKQFLTTYARKTRALMELHPYLQLEKQLAYFNPY